MLCADDVDDVDDVDDDVVAMCLFSGFVICLSYVFCCGCGYYH